MQMGPICMLFFLLSPCSNSSGDSAPMIPINQWQSDYCTPTLSQRKKKLLERQLEKMHQIISICLPISPLPYQMGCTIFASMKEMTTILQPQSSILVGQIRQQNYGWPCCIWEDTKDCVFFNLFVIISILAHNFILPLKSPNSNPSPTDPSHMTSHLLPRFYLQQNHLSGCYRRPAVNGEGPEEPFPSLPPCGIPVMVGTELLWHGIQSMVLFLAFPAACLLDTALYFPTDYWPSQTLPSIPAYTTPLPLYHTHTSPASLPQQFSSLSLPPSLPHLIYCACVRVPCVITASWSCTPTPSGVVVVCVAAVCMRSVPHTDPWLMTFTALPSGHGWGHLLCRGVAFNRHPPMYSAQRDPSSPVP